jgi:flap endonuclease-1
MGIKDLFSFINAKHSEVIEYILLSDFQNKKIAIDGNLLLRKHWSVFVSEYVDGMDIAERKLDLDLILINTLNSLLGFINTLLSCNITPIFIFDGGMQIEKKGTCDERKKIITNTQEYLNELMIKYEADPLIFTDKEEKEVRSCWKRITKPNFNKVKNLLSSLGIPVIMSKTDGEKLCCSLYLEGKVDAVFADDSDCIPFGALDLFTKIEKTETGFKAFKSINVLLLLDKLEIKFEQMIDACIISGCDYNEGKGIKGYSMTKAIQDIKRFNNIEGMMENLKLDFNLCKHNICRDIFKYASSSELMFDDCPLNLLSIDESFVIIKELSYQINLFKKLRNENEVSNNN